MFNLVLILLTSSCYSVVYFFVTLFIFHGKMSILFIQLILNLIIRCVPAVICFIALSVKDNLGDFKWPQSNISAHPLNNNNNKNL